MGKPKHRRDLPWRPPNYRKGYSTRDYHVTGGHEAEALAAQRAKKPTRLGSFVLRLLGYKGPMVGAEPDADHSSSRHVRHL